LRVIFAGRPVTAFSDRALVPMRLRPVHDLDSFGAIPLESKVE
jgi:hypothetical protein